MTTTIGSRIQSASSFQIAQLFVNMQKLVSWIKYNHLANNNFGECTIWDGDKEYQLNPAEGGSILPQMLFKEPSNIGEQVFWAVGLAEYSNFIDWWMKQPYEPSSSDGEDLEDWYDFHSIVDMYNTYVAERLRADSEGI